MKKLSQVKHKYVEMFPNYEEEFGLFILLFGLLPNTPTKQDLEKANKNRELLYEFLEKLDVDEAL